MTCAKDMHTGHALLAIVLALLVTACATPPAQVSPRERAALPVVSADPGPKAPAQPAERGAQTRAAFTPASWTDLPGWTDDASNAAWNAFIASCGPLVNRAEWREVCVAASRLTTPNASAARAFFERHFVAWQIANDDGTSDGLITGYYEPLLRGSRKEGGRYRFPLYAVPDDLITVDLAGIYPELKTMRLRGRLQGRRIVPYYDRSQIESASAPLRGRELLWVDDAIDLFFLHIQGSGRVALDDGRTIRVGYADQNGHPYRSIGRVLVERGDLTLEQASMQGIKQWAREHPQQLGELLNSNRSYVFFRDLGTPAAGPPGALGVALTPERSIAVDPRHVPLGAPVYIATTWPGTTARPLNRLMVAQDTGGAIRGAVRADFFWGHGEAAEREAGRMKERLRMWILLPHGYPPPSRAEQLQRLSPEP